MEESRKKKRDLRKKVNVWKKANPDWRTGEAMETAKGQLTYLIFRAILSIRQDTKEADMKCV